MIIYSLGGNLRMGDGNGAQIIVRQRVTGLNLIWGDSTPKRSKAQTNPFKQSFIFMAILLLL